MSYRSNRDPQASWRHIFEGRRNPLYANPPKPLKALVPWSFDDVQAILDNPSLIDRNAARETLDALLDQRQSLTPDAEPLRVALYEVLRARRNLEHSSRLKAMQKLEGCACGRIDYVQELDGSRLCECGRRWRIHYDTRPSVIQAKIKRDDGTEVIKAITINAPTAINRRDHLIEVEV